MIVDVHSHYYPPEYLERIGRLDVPPPAAVLAHYSLDERVALLDRTGVDCEVLSVSQAQPYLPDAADAAGAARLVNDVYLAVCDRYPGRFYSFAALPLPHVEEALAEVERMSSEGRVVGVTIGCSVGTMQLDDARLEPLWSELDRRRMTVFLHPIGQEQTDWLLGKGLAWIVGAPFEDTAAAMRLVLSGMHERYPKLRFIVPHLGGTLPFLLARVSRHAVGEVLAGLRSMYYDTVNGSADALGCSCRAFGPDRLLFGTDFPYCDEDGFARHLSYLEEGGLGAAELAGVKGGNAASLLGLEGPAFS